MYFEIYQSETSPMNALFGIGGAAVGSEWRWRLRGGNHEIIASGEGYTTKANCTHAVSLLRQTTAFTPLNEVTA